MPYFFIPESGYTFINRINKYFNNLNRTKIKGEAKIVIFLMCPDEEARATEKELIGQHQVAGFSLCEKRRRQGNFPIMSRGKLGAFPLT